MKSIKKYYIKLPRAFRIWWGKQFIWMLGHMGRDEFNSDMKLFVELTKWLENETNRK